MRLVGSELCERFLHITGAILRFIDDLWKFEITVSWTFVFTFLVYLFSLSHVALEPILFIHQTVKAIHTTFQTLGHLIHIATLWHNYCQDGENETQNGTQKLPQVKQLAGGRIIFRLASFGVTFFNSFSDI